MSEAHKPSSESPLAEAAAAVLEMPSTFVEGMSTDIDAGEVVALSIEAWLQRCSANNNFDDLYLQ